MIPKTISRALIRQRLPVLYEIRDLVESLISNKESPETREMIAKREVLNLRKEGEVTYRLERVFCGKGCKGCPHGPYWYGYWKESGKTRSRYIGKRLKEP